jgi:hypothetical protein
VVSSILQCRGLCIVGLSTGCSSICHKAVIGSYNATSLNIWFPLFSCLLLYLILWSEYGMWVIIVCMLSLAVMILQSLPFGWCVPFRVHPTFTFSLDCCLRWHFSLTAACWGLLLAGSRHVLVLLSLWETFQQSTVWTSCSWVFQLKEIARCTRYYYIKIYEVYIFVVYV